MARDLKLEKDKCMVFNYINSFKKKSSFALIIMCIYSALLNSCVVTHEQPPIITSTPFIEDKPSIDVCFSPEGNFLPIILNLINNAKTEILVQSYSFTSENIANAFMRAHQRGIKVKILFDRSQLSARYSQIYKIREVGIDCLVDPVPGIAHNKIIIIDKNIVLTGSYNWTNAAEMRNAENLLIINDRSTVKIYKKNWIKRYERAKEINLQNFTKKSLPDKTLKPKRLITKDA